MHTTTRKRNNVIEVNSLIGQDRLFADIAKQPVSLKNGSKVYLLYSRGSLLTCIAFEHVGTNSQRILAIPCPLSLIYFLAIFRVKSSFPAAFPFPGPSFFGMAIFSPGVYGKLAEKLFSRWNAVRTHLKQAYLLNFIGPGQSALFSLQSGFPLLSLACSAFCACLIGIAAFAVISVAMFSVVTFAVTGAFCFPLLLGSVIYFTHGKGPSLSSRRGMLEHRSGNIILPLHYITNPPHKQYQEVS